MNEDVRRSSSDRGRGAAPAAMALLAALALLVAPVALAGAGSGGSRGEARGLRWGLEEAAELARQRLAPPARRLAQGLPADADRLGRLLEPASTTQTQVGVALDQLQQMSALVYDPHYLPALAAVARAFAAVSGRDPFTGTAIDPEYSGLGQELAGEASRLQRSGAEARDLSRNARRLTRRLTAARRRARRLEWQLRRMRPRPSPAAGRR